LRIAATPKGGAVAPFTDAPVSFDWPWYWHLPALLPWLLLGLALALPRTNRNRHALLILVPLLVVGLLWAWVTKLAGMPSASQMQSSFLIEFLLVGLALLWLNADKIGRCRGFMRLAVSLGILLLAALVTALSYGSTFPEAQGIALPIASTVAGLILLVALALTRWLSHRRYRPLRFLLWLAVWCTLCTLVSATIFVSILMLVSSLPIRNLQDVNRQILTPGLLMALCLYAVNFPYLLLMITSPFFRRRFHIWLGIESASVPSAEPRDVSGS
jgi:hypothetical protein